MLTKKQQGILKKILGWLCALVVASQTGVGNIPDVLRSAIG